MGRCQRLLLAAVAACAIVWSLPSGALASNTQEMVVQDDSWLIYKPAWQVLDAMDVMKQLGVDRIRVSVVWSLLAPEPNANTEPKFDATNPDAYPAGVWQRYDNVVSLAKAVGLKVYFQLTAPAPMWATPPRGLPQGYRWSHDPSAKKFGQFVEAVGRRYHGLVDYWGIWNEPNIGGWMTPQWRRVHGHQEQASPAIYRGMLDAAWRGLQAAGDGGNTILIGETGAYGYPWKGYGADMSPLVFLRALYCVRNNYKPLRGHAARLIHCPASGRRASFVAAHPALFGATGWAHHPYDFLHGPGVHLRDRGAADLADLGRIERVLDRVRGAYRKEPKLPLYVTEWGYQTNPPDPYAKFSLTEQATWLNQGEYLAWKDPRVRSFAQFLLFDSDPFTQYPAGSRAYWSSFQTGLVEPDGTIKPSYHAFQLPIWLPHPRHGSNVAIWGQIRPGPHTGAESGQLMFLPAGSSAWKPLATVTTTNPEGFFLTHVAIPSAGSVELTITDPTFGNTDISRVVPVS